MSNKKEEKLSITEVHVSNKERFLTITHDITQITKGGKMIKMAGVIWPGNQPVHQDLLDQLQLLVPHALQIIEMPGFKTFNAEYHKDKLAITDDELKGFYISGFSISAKGLITLKGGIKTEGGRVTSINAPITSLDLETSQYEQIVPLVENIERIFAECDGYFINGKFGAGAQPEIWDDAKPAEQNA